LLLGSVFANLGNYLYHLLMGRFLGPSSYGVLESLISILTLLSIPISVLTLVVVKFVSQLKALDKDRQEKVEKTNEFIKAILKKILIFGLLVSLLFLVCTPYWQKLAKIEGFTLFFGVAIAFFLSIFASIFLAVLQGLMEFTKLSFMTIFTSWSKLLIGVLLVVLGFKVGGAIYAIVLATFFTILLGYRLSGLNIFSGENNNSRFLLKGIGSYSGYALLSLFSLNSLFWTDVILARHFLSPVAAGQYAALSVLGKIIFFAANPVILVMFPMVSERQSNNKDFKKLVYFSLLIVLLISVFISLIYFIFPATMVGLLFGKDYLSAAANLGSFAVFISLYSLSALLVNFYLSVSENKTVIFPVIAAVSQVIIISLYHESIEQIILINIMLLFLLLLGLTIYFIRRFADYRLLA